MSYIAEKFIKLINPYLDETIDIGKIVLEEYEKENISNKTQAAGRDQNDKYIEIDSYTCKGKETEAKKTRNQVFWTLIGFLVMGILFLFRCVLELLKIV